MIEAQAVAEYPLECCGVLIAEGGGRPVQVHPCRNIQDQLNTQAPHQYPRDARTGYYIDPGQLFQILVGTEKRGGRIWGFYHSHIDCPAFFSAEDRERAILWGEPLYPEAVYLIVSICVRIMKSYRGFSWNKQEQDFTQVDLEVLG